MELGARDVSYTAIQMKKNRPGIKLEVMCHMDDINTMIETIFRESSSIGVRINEVKRVVMDREEVLVETRYGSVRCKKASYKDIVKVSPEYSEYSYIANKKSISINEVYKNIQMDIEENYNQD